LFANVAHQVVDHLVQSENLTEEKHIFVHQINVMELVQKKYLLKKQVSNLADEQKKTCFIQEIQSTTTISATLSSTQTTVSTTIQSSFACYECLGLNEQQCTTTTLNCPMCMVYRNDNDPGM
jgi:carbohydrate-binding DOMON domain-containing protein